MATNQDEIQPAQDQCREVDPSWSEDEFPEQEMTPPTEKSGVYVDPKALKGSGKYQTKDKVHMSIIEAGTRTKGTFRVHRGQRGSHGQWEYQLIDANGNLYKKGEWIREKQLRTESGGRS